MKKSEIKLVVELDDDQIPEKILWDADEKDSSGLTETKSMSLSLWDHEKKNTMRIDLWTKDMPVDEMKVFFHQTLVAMSNTFSRATQDDKMTATMKDFCDYFAEKLELKID